MLILDLEKCAAVFGVGVLLKEDTGKLFDTENVQPISIFVVDIPIHTLKDDAFH